MNTSFLSIQNPSDFFCNLLPILKESGSWERAEAEGEHVHYCGEKVLIHMRRVILARGFELFINKCRLYEDFSFQAYLSYDALEIIAYIDNDTNELTGCVRYMFSFWKRNRLDGKIQKVSFEKSNRTYIMLFVDIAYLTNFFDLAMLRNAEHHIMQTLSRDDSQEMFGIMKMIIENKWDDIPQRIFYHGKALECLSMIVQVINRSQIELHGNDFSLCGEDRLALEQIQAIIKNSYHENLTIEGLSRIVCRNNNWVKSTYKAAYGVTIHQDIINHRMNKALELLRGQGYSVEETARQIGYEYPSHFISTFKKLFGMTPGVFSKMK